MPYGELWVNQRNSTYDERYKFTGKERDAETGNDFLQQRMGIANKEKLSAALREMVAKTDLKTKQRDFEHLLFDTRKSEVILRFLDSIPL